jgi:hypothetical protein
MRVRRPCFLEITSGNSWPIYPVLSKRCALFTSWNRFMSSRTIYSMITSGLAPITSWSVFAGCCGFKALSALSDFLESFLAPTVSSFLDRYRALKYVPFFLFHSSHFFLCHSFWQVASPHVFWCPLLRGFGVYHRPHTRQGRLSILRNNYIIPLSLSSRQKEWL